MSWGDLVMKIAYHAYELIPRSPLVKKRAGALLQVEFLNGSIGYSDCHPWTELEDLSLNDQLKLLAQGKVTALTKRSLQFARIDAEARAKEINLFSGVHVPSSHFLLPNLNTWNSKDIEEILRQGFSHVKIKLGNDIKNQTMRLRAFLSYLPIRVKVRLDFNMQLSAQTFKFFLDELGDDKYRVDFFEDPFSFDKDQWEHFQKNEEIALACDYHSQQAVGHVSAAQILVIKPAVQALLPFQTAAKTQRLVVTSYLDHPLGQLTAAYMAAQLEVGKEICGLVSHKFYQPNPYSEQLSLSHTALVPPSGNGFGFDALLKEAQWTSLKT